VRFKPQLERAYHSHCDQLLQQWDVKILGLLHSFKLAFLEFNLKTHKSSNQTALKNLARTFKFYQNSHTQKNGQFQEQQHRWLGNDSVIHWVK
jgi:hypothetical protein